MSIFFVKNPGDNTDKANLWYIMMGLTKFGEVYSVKIETVMSVLVN